MKEFTTADEVIKAVGESTPLTEEHYPIWAVLNEDQRQVFAIGHSLRHLSKTIGDMQGMIEHAEHGDTINYEVLSTKVASLGFSLCKICDVANIKGDELVMLILALAEKYKEENQQK